MLAIEWFDNNYMVLNEEKCHFRMAGYRHEQLFANVGDAQIWESNDEVLLGITIDKEMKFKEHLTKLCKKSQQKNICFSPC